MKKPKASPFVSIIKDCYAKSVLCGIICKRGKQTMDKNSVITFLQKNKKLFHDRFGVTKIGLFGSYAKDTQKDDSDIDIVVQLQSANTFRSFFGLKQFLQEKLQKKIDLGVERSLKPVVKNSIKDEIIYV